MFQHPTLGPLTDREVMYLRTTPVGSPRWTQPEFTQERLDNIRGMLSRLDEIRESNAKRSCSVASRPCS